MGYTLPNFPRFKHFDTQVQNTSWWYNMMLRVKARARLLKSQIREEIQVDTCNIASECISVVELFVVQLSYWMASEY